LEFFLSHFFGQTGLTEPDEIRACTESACQAWLNMCLEIGGRELEWAKSMLELSWVLSTVSTEQKLGRILGELGLGFDPRSGYRRYRLWCEEILERSNALSIDKSAWSPLRASQKSPKPAFRFEL
jgi:hypothetical protein